MYNIDNIRYIDKTLIIYIGTLGALSFILFINQSLTISIMQQQYKTIFYNTLSSWPYHTHKFKPYRQGKINPSGAVVWKSAKKGLGVGFGQFIAK